MIELRPAAFLEVQKYFVDFQKKARHFEMPTDDSECIGIYSNGLMAGYFIVAGYEDGTFDIEQFYLKPEARHKHLQYDATRLLIAYAASQGYKTINLKTSRSFRAYSQIMKDLGFQTESVIYSKVIS